MLEYTFKEEKMKYYILDGHNVVTVNDMIEWGKWFEKADRHIGDTTQNGVQVSTVFLGIDHNFGRKGFPILFETMVFGGEHDQEQRRYSTWEEAEEGHKKMCETVFAWGQS